MEVKAIICEGVCETANMITYVVYLVFLFSCFCYNRIIFVPSKSFFHIIFCTDLVFWFILQETIRLILLTVKQRALVEIKIP